MRRGRLGPLARDDHHRRQPAVLRQLLEPLEAGDAIQGDEIEVVARRRRASASCVTGTTSASSLDSSSSLICPPSFSSSSTASTRIRSSAHTAFTVPRVELRFAYRYRESYFHPLRPTPVTSARLFKRQKTLAQRAASGMIYMIPEVVLYLALVLAEEEQGRQHGTFCKRGVG